MRCGSYYSKPKLSAAFQITNWSRSIYGLSIFRFFSYAEFVPPDDDPLSDRNRDCGS
jgi:hypothetical protein